MPRPKREETPEIPSKDPELEQIFRDLCNDEWQALTLVKHLEGVSYSRSEVNLNICKSYTIALIQTYCKNTTEEEADNGSGKHKRIGNAEDKIEFMLAMYGLLKGFEFKKKSLGKRKRKYYDYARGYNKLVSGAWDGASIDTKLRDILNDLAWELTNTLYELKVKNGGKLGLHDQVSQNLSLPAPRDKSTEIQPSPNLLKNLFKRFIQHIHIPKIKRETINTCARVVSAIALVAIAITYGINSYRDNSIPPSMPPQTPLQDHQGAEPIPIKDADADDAVAQDEIEEDILPD